MFQASKLLRVDPERVWEFYAVLFLEGVGHALMNWTITSVFTQSVSDADTGETSSLSAIGNITVYLGVRIHPTCI